MLRHSCFLFLHRCLCHPFFRLAERNRGRCLLRKDTSPEPPPETWGRFGFAPTPPNDTREGAAAPSLGFHPQGVFFGGVSKGEVRTPPLCVVSRGSGGKSKSPRVFFSGCGGYFFFKKKCLPRIQRKWGFKESPAAEPPDLECGKGCGRMISAPTWKTGESIKKQEQLSLLL